MKHMKTALVTGGAGFLGSHLCERLLADGYRVVAVDNLYTGSTDNIAGYASNPNFTFIKADLADQAILSPSVPAPLDFPDVKFSEIYNLACPASPVHYQARPIFSTLTSVRGILFCLALARRDGAKLLHASTSEVYGDALVHPQEEHYWGNVNTIGIRSCYDEGKRVAETLLADHVREFDVDARMVRIFNTYGQRMHPQDGSQTRSFQYCSDLIEAFRRYMELPKEKVRAFAAAHGLGTPVINTGNPGEYTIRQLAEKTLEFLSESTSRIVYRPLPGDDPKRRRPDITLAKELLGWEPKVALDEGLARTVEYFRGRVEKEAHNV